MPKSKPTKSSSDPRELLKRLNDRFPNFLLGLTVFVLVILVGSLFFQNKELTNLNLPQAISKLFNGDKKTETPSARSYTVKKGDTLWSIAEEAYGSGYNAYDLAKTNNIVDPNILNEGVVLSLPAMDSKIPTKGEIASGVFTTQEETPQTTITQAPTEKKYVIKQGDSLWLIAMKVYGNPYRWTELWTANPSIQNPDVIYAGNNLTLP